jgi:hypothetical protein
MQEAMSREEWERQDKGLPPLKKEKIVRPEPNPPKVEKVIKFDAIPLDRFVRLLNVKRNMAKNEDGMRFIGYDVEMEIKYKAKKQKPLEKVLSEEEEKETYILSGWMPEGDWLQFVRTMRKQLDLNAFVI